MSEGVPPTSMGHPGGYLVPSQSGSFSAIIASWWSASRSCSPRSACSWCVLQRVMHQSSSAACSMVSSSGMMWCVDRSSYVIAPASKQSRHRWPSRSFTLSLVFRHSDVFRNSCALVFFLLFSGFCGQTNPSGCNLPHHLHDCCIPSTACLIIYGIILGHILGFGKHLFISRVPS